MALLYKKRWVIEIPFKTFAEKTNMPFKLMAGLLGDYPTHKRLVRDLVVASEYAAVFVNYTLSPEAHYPQAINEIYAAAKWVSEHGDEINVDGKNMAAVGNSAGGNMTTALCMMAKDKGGPVIKLQILMWPATDASFSQVSYELYGQQRFLTLPLMKWSWDRASMKCPP